MRISFTEAERHLAFSSFTLIASFLDYEPSGVHGTLTKWARKEMRGRVLDLAQKFEGKQNGKDQPSRA